MLLIPKLSTSKVNSHQHPGWRQSIVIPSVFDRVHRLGGPPSGLLFTSQLSFDELASEAHGVVIRSELPATVLPAVYRKKSGCYISRGLSHGRNGWQQQVKIVMERWVGNHLHETILRTKLSSIQRTTGQKVEWKPGKSKSKQDNLCQG
ncbi:hypothetical protein H6P81_015199 [Aristolochia fimbriata]|uniref:Uncharacterized protein n=1 Tax=Aristolochia fimbriata TaxID=158543 RepID=A0AAV7E6Q3_ARIFI|nr:hypothetical protein H6P81_015199 [Aristolochia fimbriata]